MSYWYLGQWSNTTALLIVYDDPSLLYGATVFTTCRVYEKSLDHVLTLWSAHRARLKDSLVYLGWTLPTWDQVEQGVNEVIHHLPDRPIIRVTIFPDGRELIFGRELPADLAQRQQQGIVAKVVQGFDRSLPSHKTGNYLAPWLAKQQVAPSAAEAILADVNGRWLETSTGNLWGWDGEKYYSPAIDSLAGIARTYLVQWLQSQGKIVDEQPWDENIIDRFVGLAYSNSVVQLVPIHTVIAATGIRHYPQPNFSLLTQAFLGDFTENRKKTWAEGSAGNERSVNIS
jgi:4-amino-4-deoxychorismate lyase